jgi:hypothetical protein
MRTLLIFLQGLLLLSCLPFAQTQVSAQTLTFSQVRLVGSGSGLVTVPAGKVWKLENVLAGAGTLTATGAISHHCGSSCSGGGCNPFSCSYRMPLYTINGLEFSRVNGCNACGSGCNSLGACPPTFTYAYAPSDLVFEGPVWLPAATTMQVNGTGILFSVIEFTVNP